MATVPESQGREEAFLSAPVPLSVFRNRRMLDDLSTSIRRHDEKGVFRHPTLDPHLCDNRVRSCTISDKKVVQMNYKGLLDDGSVFSQSATGSPLEFQVGAGKMIPALEHGIMGLKVGDKKTINIKAADAYGEYDRPQSRTFQGPVSRWHHVYCRPALHGADVARGHTGADHWHQG